MQIAHIDLKKRALMIAIAFTAREEELLGEISQWLLDFQPPEHAQ